MRYLDHDKLMTAGKVVVPPAARACSDQNFGLPTGIYVAMAMLFAGSVAVMSFAFSDHLAVSFGIIFAFFTMFFAVPSLFPIAGRQIGKRAARWDEFVHQGIDTATGRVSARSATMLILLLPALIFCFAIAVAIVAVAV